MAGIDKIYLTSFQEYSHLEQFCEKHNSEFFKKHKYYLSCGLYDDITSDTFIYGNEHPVSNFCTEADVFIIQHLSETDIENMPNVVARLKEQYSDFDLIRQHKSEYDLYQIDRSGCSVKLCNSSNNKTLRHIKRERWEQVYITVSTKKVKKNISNYSKYDCLVFDCFNRIIYPRYTGCKYYKCAVDKFGNEDIYLHSVSMRQVYKYITRVRLKRNTEICVFCCNFIRDVKGSIIGISSKAEYDFVV